MSKGGLMKTIIKRFFVLVVFFVMSSVSHASEGTQIKPSKNLKTDRILFVGNSYLYYNDSLHNHVKRMVQEKFPKEKNSLAINLLPLVAHVWYTTILIIY